MDNKAFTQEERNHIPKNALVQMYLQLASSFELISNQLETLQQQNQSLVKTMDSLQEKMDLLTQARFGRKTEKLFEPEMETITYKRKKQKGKPLRTSFYVRFIVNFIGNC